MIIDVPSQYPFNTGGPIGAGIVSYSAVPGRDGAPAVAENAKEGCAIPCEKGWVGRNLSLPSPLGDTFDGVLPSTA